MKVRIEFTHNRGQLAARGNSVRAPLEGKLGSHMLMQKTGSHQVVKRQSVNVMDKPMA